MLIVLGASDSAFGESKYVNKKCVRKNSNENSPVLLCSIG